MPDITRVNCSNGVCAINIPDEAVAAVKAKGDKPVPMSGRTVNVNEVK